MRDDQSEPVKIDVGTRLAMDRTLLAHERTLMAWIRTSASLISFGFTIYKFFEYFTDAKSAPRGSALVEPRHFGMGMIFVGVATLVIATWDYHREMNEFQAQYGHFRKSPVGKIAGVVSVLGVGLFIVLWLNL